MVTAGPKGLGMRCSRHLAPRLPAQAHRIFPHAVPAATQQHQWHPHHHHHHRPTLGNPLACYSATSTPSPSESLSPAPSSLPPPSPRPAPLLLYSGAFVLPHPAKTLKGGEDWYFVSGSQRAIGVADGVGGWASIGIDAGAYARMLMDHACRVADSQANSTVTSCSDRDEYEALMYSGYEPDVPIKLCAQQILDIAYNMTDVKGSSTVCIAVLNGTSLQASNLGDSGLLILRADGSVVLSTSQQQHSFNFPYQVGGDKKGDQPHQADRYEVGVEAGDVIVMATDGLWDNCYNEEIIAVVKHCRKQGYNAVKTARTLAVYARRRAADLEYMSPFAMTARQAGIDFTGGKMDDITVLVSFVERADAPVKSEDGFEAMEPGEEPGWTDMASVGERDQKQLQGQGFRQPPFEGGQKQMTGWGW